MVRALSGPGVLAQWLTEIEDSATLDVISGFGDTPLRVANGQLFHTHYPGRFLFGAGRATPRLIRMLIAEGADDVRIVHPRNRTYGFLHAKIYRARYREGEDDELTLWAIGSTNLTPSSLNTSWESIVIYEEGDESPYTDDEWNHMVSPPGADSVLVIQNEGQLNEAQAGGWLKNPGTGQRQRRTVIPPAVPANQEPPQPPPAFNAGWGFAMTMTQAQNHHERFRSVPGTCAQEEQAGLINLIHPYIGNAGREALLDLDGNVTEIRIATNHQIGNYTGQLNLSNVPPPRQQTLAAYTTPNRVIRVSNIGAEDGSRIIVDFPFITELPEGLPFNNIPPNQHLHAVRRWAIYDYPEEG